MPPVPIPQAFSLALQYHQAGRLAEAEALYRQVLAAQPNHAEAWHYLGVIAHQKGRHDLAVKWISQSLTLQPNNPGACYHLGEACRATKRFDEAIEWYRRAIQNKPDQFEFHLHLGVVLAEQGCAHEAIVAYRTAIQLKDDCAAAYYNLGNALKNRGELNDAIIAYRRAIELLPTDPEAHYNLGLAFYEVGRLDDALSEYRGALDLKPNYGDAYNNLGITLAAQGRLDEAIAAYKRSLELKIGYTEGYNNLSNALRDKGLLEESLASYRRALEIDPQCAAVHSNLIYTLHFHPDENTSTIAEEHRRWNRQFSAPLDQSVLGFPNERNTDRRLRIGYVSPDFRGHAMAFFLTPLFEAHDHSQYEIFCYSSVQRPDEVTQRIRRSSDVWRDVRVASDAQLAENIRTDGIDILVDLAMHTAGNRLLVFARKPAPIQVSWLAYPGSSGVEAIDYRLTDAHIDPSGPQETILGGRPIRLPNSWCCYLPIEEFPRVGPLPAAQNGFVTFGSLNQFGKVHDGVLRCWAKLLKKVPASRLLMVCPTRETKDRLHNLFAGYGIAAERLQLIEPKPWAEFVRLFGQVDIALDSFPRNGMTTTCHALWMGVPVITLAGKTSVSRVGSSLLHTLGFPEWVARDEDEYIRIAAECSAELPRLAELRHALRTRMQSSPLMDAPRFAHDVENAYRTMWKQWCEEHRFSPT